MEYYEDRDSVCDFVIEDVVDPTKTNTEIQSFYAGKSIFITGSTGLIGSLLMEHLLRTCPKIEQIYLLLRPKKGKSPEERLNSIFETQLFYKVRRMYKDPKKKVQILSGDVSLPECGLSQNDQQILIEKVDIIFHSAAALRMDEPLRTSYYMNVRATEDLLKIGTKMKKLKAFIYVSTAYAFSFLSDISEKFYKTEYSPDDIKQLVDLLTDEELACMTPKIFGPWINSYAFTKSLAERLTEQYSHIIPAAITRPSIVIGCEKEPLKGWINNMYGATGVSLAGCLGIMRVWYGDANKIADIIPADKVVTAMIAIAWQVGTSHIKKKQIKTPVYNIVSSTKSPQNWGEYMELTEYYAYRDQIIPNRFAREYDFHQENRMWMFRIKTWIYHVLFAVLFDLFLKFKGKQPMLLRGFTKIHRFNLSLEFYARREWIYNQDNVDKIWEEMTPLDKKIFNFNMANFDWKTFHSYTIRAIAVFLLDDDLTHIEESRKRYGKISIIRKCFTGVFYILVIYFSRHYIYSCYKFLDYLII